MSLIRWQPLAEVEALRRQMDQLFDEFAPITREPLLATVNRAVRTPAIELHVTPNDVVLRAELPGIDGKDLDIKVTREAVSIAGHYRSETADGKSAAALYHSEFRYGKFHRVIGLPVEVQNEAAQAEFKDGILTLTLPKLVADRAKVFQVNLGHPVATEVQPEVPAPGTAPTPQPEVPVAPPGAS